MIGGCNVIKKQKNKRESHLCIQEREMNIMCQYDSSWNQFYTECRCEVFHFLMLSSSSSSRLQANNWQLQLKGIPAKQATFGALALLFPKSYFVWPLTESREVFTRCSGTLICEEFCQFTVVCAPSARLGGRRSGDSRGRLTADRRR